MRMRDKYTTESMSNEIEKFPNAGMEEKTEEGKKSRANRINSEGINNKLCVWVLIFTMNHIEC